MFRNMEYICVQYRCTNGLYISYICPVKSSRLPASPFIHTYQHCVRNLGGGGWAPSVLNGIEVRFNSRASVGPCLVAPPPRVCRWSFAAPLCPRLKEEFLTTTGRTPGARMSLGNGLTRRKQTLGTTHCLVFLRCILPLKRFLQPVL